jgi:hypothetical protein
MTTEKITREQAIATGLKFGQNLAGQYGSLTLALQAFKDDQEVRSEMLKAISIGYIMRKFDIDKAEATRIVGLKKFNEKKVDDDHRTFEQERVMGTVRMLWSRANKLAGIVAEKTPNQIKADQTRAAKEAAKKVHESQMEQAWEIVHPTAPTSDIDVDAAMARFVMAMRSYHDGHATKFTGDSGSAWRDWIAAAPTAKGKGKGNGKKSA